MVVYIMYCVYLVYIIYTYTYTYRYTLFVIDGTHNIIVTAYAVCVRDVCAAARYAVCFRGADFVQFEAAAADRGGMRNPSTS